MATIRVVIQIKKPAILRASEEIFTPPDLAARVVARLQLRTKVRDHDPRRSGANNQARDVQTGEKYRAALLWIDVRRPDDPFTVIRFAPPLP